MTQAAREGARAGALAWKHEDPQLLATQTARVVPVPKTLQQTVIMRTEVEPPPAS